MGNEQSLIVITPRCADPEIEDKVTAYCFGDLKEVEGGSVETHVLDCDKCRAEAERMTAAVQILRTDKRLLKLITPAEVASAFGISSKLEQVFGGHTIFVLVASFIYAVLYGVALLVEVAYQYDRYAATAPYIAAGASVWILLTTLAALWLDWKLTMTGRSSGLKVTILAFMGAALILFGAICLYLPTSPITELSFQAYPAQAAYLKTIGYFIVLSVIFLLPTYHFILAMQRQMLSGHYELTSGLLRGDPIAVSPKGTIYPKFWFLTTILGLFIAISWFLHHNLMSNLRPGAYQWLFSNLILSRLLLFYLLAAVCLFWYYLSLNEIKRECLAASRIAVRRDG